MEYVKLPRNLVNFLRKNGYEDDTYAIASGATKNCVLKLADSEKMIPGFDVLFEGTDNGIFVSARLRSCDFHSWMYSAREVISWDCVRRVPIEVWLDDVLKRLTLALFTRVFNVFTSDKNGLLTLKKNEQSILM